MTAERPDADVASGVIDDDALAGIRAELAEAESAETEARAEAAQARARISGLGEETGDRRWTRTAGPAAAALLAGAGFALAGLMLWQHSQVAGQRAAGDRFVDAARDGVTALLTIDHARATEDVQRVLDLSTGQFHDDFQRNAEDFVKTAVGSKAVTTGTVNASALESVTGDSATVLVAATSKVSNANGANQDPRPFRISVTVTCETDTCKMSDVEFVP